MFLRLCLITTLCFSSNLFSSSQISIEETEKLAPFCSLNNQINTQDQSVDQKKYIPQKRRNRTKAKNKLNKQPSIMDEINTVSITAHLENDIPKDSINEKLKSLEEIFQEEAETLNFYQTRASESIKEAKAFEEKNYELTELLEKKKSESLKKDQQINDLKALLALNNLVKNFEETQTEELENQSKQIENFQKILEEKNKKIENYEKEREFFLEIQDQHTFLQQKYEDQSKELIRLQKINQESDQRILCQDTALAKQINFLRSEKRALQNQNMDLNKQVEELNRQIKEKNDKWKDLLDIFQKFGIAVPTHKGVSDTISNTSQN